MHDNDTKQSETRVTGVALHIGYIVVSFYPPFGRAQKFFALPQNR